MLVTGGLGFVGSHVCVALAEAGYDIVALDNLANARLSVLARLREIAGRRISFVRADVRDGRALAQVFRRRPVAAVLHFAGLKAVHESVAQPLEYYDTNVGGTLTLLRAMRQHDVRRLVFSSSCTVYGAPESLPLTETHPLRPANPYGRTKMIAEGLIADCAAAWPELKYALLRYFNPVGAHPSGRIGEDPLGVPNNLFPYIAQVAVGRRAKLNVWGGDYDTQDGTGVRDYIHVMDLAAGHVAALARLESQPESFTVNLGTGRGYSVLEVVKTFERVCGRPIPYEIRERRAGDLAQSWADATLAERLLGWRARYGLEDMCRDAWRWQSLNPDGYPERPVSAAETRRRRSRRRS
ncbi:MAG: UDP-glucose 4-epimerase GalE [Burkholderiales bacterium]|nr:UDP-glucose 4-epimerase GalE [Burkholderiales bacterium]